MNLDRLEIHQKKSNDLIWILEHKDLYTAGTSYSEDEIIDKSIKINTDSMGVLLLLRSKWPLLED